jgi:hypothetical protein
MAMPSAALIDVPESVKGAFLTGGKWCQPTGLLDGSQLVAPPGQHLVRIGLVAHIPDEPVLRCVEDAMKGNRQFHRAQSCREMPPHLADRGDQVAAQFVIELLQLRARQIAQVGR